MALTCLRGFYLKSLFNTGIIVQQKNNFRPATHNPRVPGICQYFKQDTAHFQILKGCIIAIVIVTSISTSSTSIVTVIINTGSHSFGVCRINIILIIISALTALMAIFELMSYANIILQGLIAIVAASLTCSELFG